MFDLDKITLKTQFNNKNTNSELIKAFRFQKHQATLLIFVKFLKG